MSVSLTLPTGEGANSPQSLALAIVDAVNLALSQLTASVIQAGTTAAQVAGAAAGTAAAESALTGGQPYSATLSGSTITEDINGQPVTTIITPGTIVQEFGAPTNQTWTTTISNGQIQTTRTS